MQINIEVWISNSLTHRQRKVAEGLFIFVAIDENGRTRRIQP